MNYKEIIKKIDNGQIKYPRLRDGEEFSSEKIFLHLYRSNNVEVGSGKLYDNLKIAVQDIANMNITGEYYLKCKESPDNDWRINLNFK